jgi:hypothetical protein
MDIIFFHFITIIFMKKLMLTLIVGLIGFTGTVIETANATPPPPPPPPITMVTAHYIHAYFAPCHVYRYFAKKSDALAYIAVSAPAGTYTYVGTTLVPSTYTLTFPGTEVYECSGTGS